MNTDDPDEQEVGYGRPPKHTRFRKGRSGNPAGRPKSRPKAPEPYFPGIYPTRELFSKVAKHAVAVREGEKVSQISMTEAVIQGLGRKAISGSVLAARTYLDYQSKEDERIAREREESFQFWMDYADRKRENIVNAKAKGLLAPDPIPHPEDIVFDHLDRTFKFIGPSNHEGAAQIRYQQALSLLMHELGLFYGETTTADPEAGLKIGLWTAIFLNLQLALPKRLQGIDGVVGDAISQRLMGPRRKWSAYLENQCAALDIPFVPERKSWPTWSLAKVGLGYLAATLKPLTQKSAAEPKPVRYRKKDGF